jgi:menaquinol-cytochrome c reductase iron-sulfur subunit
MNRRELLEWISRGLAAGVAAVIGLPGIRFILGTIQSESTSASQFERVMRLKDLTAGRPTIVPIMGQKRDAWTQSDKQVIGRVWLVRDAASSVESATAGASVRALSSNCPHMGCQLQSQAGGNAIVCPCHRATFGADGSRQPDPRTGERNHAPRDLDRVDCRLALDEATGDWWVEVKYEKTKSGSNVA